MHRTPTEPGRPRTGRPALTLVTRTCQPDYSTTGLLTALEAAWRAIRDRHREVPAVVLIVGTGSPQRANDRLTLGHYAHSTWQHGDARLPEVMVSGEGLSRTPSEVLSTLLHEAAHGIAAMREIRDTSRQGRWHNRQFAAIATEVGLSVTKDPRIGWSPSTLQADTEAAYAEVISGLGDAMRAYRRIDLPGSTGRANSNNGLSAECDCGRKIRISVAVYNAGPVRCGLCETAFIDPDAEDGQP